MGDLIYYTLITIVNRGEKFTGKMILINIS